MPDTVGDPQAIVKTHEGMEEGLVSSGRQTFSTALLNASASGNTEFVAAVTGQRIRVLWAIVTNNSSTTNTVHFQSATTRITADHRLLEGAGWADTYLPHYLCQTAEGEALNFNLSAAAAVGVDIGYILV